MALTAEHNAIIDAFILRLKSEGLVIVPAEALEESKQYRLRLERHRLMKKKAITFSQCINAGFFSLTSTEGLQHWRRAGKFSAGEVYQDSKGHWHIMTAAITRLGGTIE